MSYKPTDDIPGADGGDGRQEPAPIEPEAIRILTDPNSWLSGGTAGSASSSTETRAYSDDFRLSEGSRVAVIGGGPAGSLFAQFLLKTLSRTGTSIELDIFEPRNFDFCGPAGCNHCGGVVSESLVQLLAAEGIVLPDEKRWIETEAVVTWENRGKITRGGLPPGYGFRSPHCPI